MRTHRPRPATIPRSAFAGFCFPRDVIVLAVRWYLRFALSYRDVEELLTERGIQVDHVTIYRWVLRFTPLLAEAARPCRHAVGDRWQVDETYVKVAASGATSTGRSTSSGRSSTCSCPRGGTRQRPAGSSNAPSARCGSRQSRWSPTTRRCTRRCSRSCCRRPGIAPIGMPTTTSRPTTGRLKSRLHPMRGLKQDRSARVVIAGHGFVQNLRRGHYELAVEELVARRLAGAFDELALAI
jgi:transposase, IS6 family